MKQRYTPFVAWVVFGIVFLLVLSPWLQHGAEATDTITILVDNSGDSQNPPPGGVGPVKPYFISYSTEWNFLFQDILAPQFYNTSFELFLNIKQETGSTPWLRIGGSTSDYTTGTYIKQYASTLKQLDKFFTDLGGDARYIWGLNFALPSNYSVVTAETQALLQAFNNKPAYLQAVEIGNECDLYVGEGYRPAGWNPLQYLAQWAAYTDVVSSIFNQSNINIKYQGGTFCCDVNWLKSLPDLASNYTNRLWSLAVHNYAQNNGNLTLLVTKDYIPYNADPYGLLAAKALGLEYWMGESGPAAGYAVNVTDHFGAGLWAIDWIFRIAVMGYTGINFQGIGGHPVGQLYMPWQSGNPPVILPLYYALVAVSRVLGGPNTYVYPAGTKLNFTSTQPLVGVFSTLDVVSGLRKVIVNHRNITPNTVNATVSISFTSQAKQVYFPTAVLYFFEAPTGFSKTGITLAGQTFEGSHNGSLLGTRTTFNVTAASGSNGNTWTFEMRPATTAFIVFCPLDNSLPCGGTTSLTSTSSSTSTSGCNSLSSWASFLSSLWIVHQFN